MAKNVNKTAEALGATVVGEVPDTGGGAWDKTVQTLRGVLSVASRPSHCCHATCEGANLRLLSAEAQGIALAGSTYGYDVMVRIGWWRQRYHATYRERVSI